MREGCGGGGKGYLGSEDKAFTVATHQDQDLFHNQSVRRLTPRECERLQGFPDDYTLIPWRKGMATDGPRYKTLGNSMAVPVVRWIGQRIQMVEHLKNGK
jgi:DNA (cytosine-5)-methyltransferase 1